MTNLGTRSLKKSSSARKPLGIGPHKTHRGVLIRKVSGRWTLPSGKDFATLKQARTAINRSRQINPTPAQVAGELTGVAVVLPIAATTTIIAAKL